MRAISNLSAVALGALSIGLARADVLSEWKDLAFPPAPELKPAKVEAASTALLLLDFTNQTCTQERRPRCAAQVPGLAKLLAEARALAGRIAAQPVHSLRMTKRLLRDSQQVALPIALEMASSLQALTQHTYDQHEAVSAFLEKRKPEFKRK